MQTITLNFSDAFSAMRSLKGIGATHLHAGRERKPLTRGQLQRLELAGRSGGALSRSLINSFMGLSNVTERYFVTGTDTEVGKTVASSALLQAARLQGKTTAGYKPVASGSEMTAQGLRNTDALALQRNSTLPLDYAAVNPYTFAEPTSPHIISADEGRPIAFSVLSDGLRALERRADWVLVEGAGGGLRRCRTN